MTVGCFGSQPKCMSAVNFALSDRIELQGVIFDHTWEGFNRFQKSQFSFLNDFPPKPGLDTMFAKTREDEPAGLTLVTPALNKATFSQYR